jgi:hydroxymethylbilane synthase
MKKIIIGARGSNLSLIQTEIVRKKLQKILPDTNIEIKIITTKGDKNMNPVPLDSVGKGWFTKEIDQALLDGSIDLAVHSLKDLPETLEDGLTISSIPEREDPSDALVSRENLSLEKLKSGAIIGTDSTRRGSQILHLRPDVIVTSLRGNVNTRLEKLNTQNYDAVILAVAGLKRLGLENKVTQYFYPKNFIPAPGQGALAIVSNENNTALNEKLKQINDAEAAIAVNAERVFSNTVGGGCKMPVGAYAVCQKEKLTIYAFVGSPDGKNIAKDSITGPKNQATELGKKLAKKLLEKSKPWYIK